ncbi:hypothetical protein [Neobacillus drentensis]|uniref:hypothetical protein n=1 Tax=Neobacillus drentensis TaxID=220684 RepID=UPI002FFFCF04
MCLLTGLLISAPGASLSPHDPWKAKCLERQSTDMLKSKYILTRLITKENE